MNQICAPEQCTGCMACLNICPVDAISQVKNKKGFYIPHIDSSICINCGKCIEVCPSISAPLPHDTPFHIYACWSNNEQLRHDSTSGGIFSLLADKVLQNDGLVFGVALNKNQCAGHLCVSDVDGLFHLRGSKYVQSQIGTCYRKVKAALTANKPVLFSGTPCQIAGLRNYLGKDYDNLLLVDLLCHGTPSPDVFSAYLSFISEQTGEKDVSNVKFRDKKYSWNLFRMKIDFVSGTNYSESTLKDPFLRAFLRDYCLNESCYTCKFIGTSRQGDITLGDFWGYLSEKYSQRNTDKGISLVMVNTQKGESWMDRLGSHDATIINKDISEAIVGNHTLSRNTKRPQNTDVFWQLFLRRRCFEDCLALLQPESESAKHKARLWLESHFYLLPENLKQLYRKLRVQKNAQKNNF